MNPQDDLEQLIRNTRHETGPALDERILGDASAALAAAHATQAASAGPGWRFTMRNWTRYAGVAALVALAVGLWATLHQSAKTAYAIQDTVEANRALRSIHLRVTGGGITEEFWAQLADDGALRRLRMSFSQTEDGPKEVVWENGQAQVWFKAKNSVTTVREPDVVKRITEFYRILDPNVVTSELYQQQASGQGKVEIQEPAKVGDPIIITATSASGGQRRVYRVNPTSKLVEHVENYRLEGQEYVLQTTWEYLEYNQALSEDVFVLNTPEDVIRGDETKKDVGMAKGKLTDEEITVQVGKAFIEALIARDYAKAGQLMGGIGADDTERLLARHLGGVSFLRIVSIGAIKEPPAGVGGLMVDIDVEVESSGVKETRTFTPAVRPVYGQPRRWALHGF